MNLELSESKKETTLQQQGVPKAAFNFLIDACEVSFFLSSFFFPQEEQKACSQAKQIYKIFFT